MFNSYYGGTQKVEINAVSGTLVKNHPKSRFVVAKSNDTLFNETRPRMSYYTKHGWESVDVVVLQAMLISDGNFLCEVVLLEDWNTPPKGE